MPQPFEPKRQNRFLVNLPVEFDLPAWTIHTTSRPKIDLRKEGYFSFTDFVLTFRDPTSPSTTQRLWNIFLAFSGIEYAPEFVKNNLDKFKDGFNYSLEMCDPTGAVVERWQMCKCRIIDIDFGSVTYSEDSLAECKITIRAEEVYLDF